MLDTVNAGHGPAKSSKKPLRNSASHGTKLPLSLTRAAKSSLKRGLTMHTKRAVPVALGVVFLVAFAASTALADAIHSHKLANLNGMEHRALHLPDVSRAEDEGYLFASIHSNNGKHLGFSAA